MMMMTGMGLLAAALPIPKAHGQPPPSGQTPTYIFQDEFDGPLGAGPDRAKWTVQSWQDDVFPPVAGQYRDDRRNVFLDGNSNLVLLATQESGQYFSGKLRGNWRGMHQPDLGSANQARLPDPGRWPAFWAVNEDPLPDGEVDIFEWYGNGSGLREPRSTH